MSKHYTADGKIPHPAQTVYGMSPWGDKEVLYVEDSLGFASTTFPSESSGAEACRLPIEACVADENNLWMLAKD